MRQCVLGESRPEERAQLANCWTRCCGVRAGPAACRARASGGEEAGGRRGQPRAAHVRRRDGGGAAAVVEERVELDPDGVDGGLHVPRGGVALGDVLEVEEEGRHDAQPVRHGEEGRGQPDHQVGDGGEGERRVGAYRGRGQERGRERPEADYFITRINNVPITACGPVTA